MDFNNNNPQNTGSNESENQPLPNATPVNDANATIISPTNAPASPSLTETVELPAEPLAAGNPISYTQPIAQAPADVPVEPAIAAPLSLTTNREASLANSQPPNTAKRHHFSMLSVIVVALIVGIVGAGAVGFIIGRSDSSDSQATDALVDEPTELTIPQGATVIAECAKGRGKQYVLPQNIPIGPVYNVHEGKVIGVEYMVGRNELTQDAKSFLNLPLHEMKYDHVNIGLLSQGHAGFPEPHYHVDIMMVPKIVTDTITCT